MGCIAMLFRCHAWLVRLPSAAVGVTFVLGSASINTLCMCLGCLSVGLRLRWGILAWFGPNL